MDKNEIDKMNPGAPGIQKLLAILNKEIALPKGRILTFHAGENMDDLSVYNPSPIEVDGETFLLARVEKKSSENGSIVLLFAKNEYDEWYVVEDVPALHNIQDPFYCGVIDGLHVIGWVQTHEEVGFSHLAYRTVFYRFENSISELNDEASHSIPPFVVGPENMKGIRLIQRANGRIGVFTRPQGTFGGRGKVGYFEIENLDQLEKSLVEYVKIADPHTLIANLFMERPKGEDEWGGVNELRNRPDGRINVLGHIADFEPYGIKKSYYPITFIFDPETGSICDLKIITTAGQFPLVETKKPDLGEVLYSGGLVYLGNGKVRLYVGIGDIETGSIDIEDPFLK
ncbi:MAG: DUF1861 family protein [Candidatus Pacebacteria bacterium]|nr:DUF1861 family protein [Candidatus Paceibacterota bacterium]